MKEFKGTGVALITPFNDDLSVDFDSLRNLVSFNIENGVDYLVVNGTTAESATITREEKLAILEVVKDENKGKLPILFGMGGNNTAALLDEISTTDLSGVDGILSVVPYYTKPSQEGIYQHYKSIANATEKPIILYNVPGRTSRKMDVATVVKLANDFSNIIGIKEASGNISDYYQIICDKPKDFMVISGDDDLALASVLAGGSGVISVIGQAFPKEFSEMIRLGLSGNNTKAYEIHFQLLSLISLIFEENNPAGIKAVLSEMNIIKEVLRLPVVQVSSELKNNIARAISKLN